MTAPDQLVWVAAVRRGITWHRIDGHGPGTVCGRSMRHGQSVSRMRATHEYAGEPCPRCTAAGSTEGFDPADGAANAGAPIHSGAAPAPSPAAAPAGEGVTPDGATATGEVTA